MQTPLLHKFQIGERRFVIDPSTCFCFECDHISWDVLELYPQEPLNHIYHLLQDKHPRRELEEVVGELEWLRVTKAILSAPAEETLLKEAAETTGIEQVTVAADAGPMPAAQRIAGAGALLLAASGACTALVLRLLFSDNAVDNVEEIAGALDATRRAAQLAGKTLDIVVQTPLATMNRASDEMRCQVAATLRDDADLVSGITETLALGNAKPGKIADALQRRVNPARALIVARPRNTRFHEALSQLYAAGFRDITLDVPGAYGENPNLDPRAMADALRANAAWYAAQLLQRRYFRAEPFATLFDAVHQGKPLLRADGAGFREFAVDNAGGVFPSVDFLGEAAFQAGSLQDGKRDPNALRPFEMVGATQTPVCFRCWARCLCGGGYACIHYRRSGNPNTPEPVWCDGQREWLAHVIDAFNTLASAGINFSHIVSAMKPGGEKISWLKAAKTAYQMRILPRPLREDDAEWLVKWENWNNAAYFVCNESGLLLATRYDREMDALHPRGVEQELVLTRTDGSPCGLLKVRPALQIPGLAQAWLYMRDRENYAASGIRRALRALLAETVRDSGMRRILVPVTPREPELAACLEAIGFKPHCVQRQALFLHGVYHEVRLFLYEA